MSEERVKFVLDEPDIPMHWSSVSIGLLHGRARLRSNVR